MTPLELLAPARDAAIGRTAIDCGADAVYIGAPAFGARAAATNSISDIACLAGYAHRYGARIYVTMNTLLLDSELEDARRTVWELYDAGADALIVQDMAYLMMDLPPIALHASTQCDIRTRQKAAALAAAGMGRVVLARELTPAQIAEVAATGVPVEVFIHGARCVSYSGDCQMGYVATGRSANRGECPQMCRLPFELVDARGRTLAPRRHYLSLSDMSTPDIAALAHAGATSFKIEGRLKDARYVANAVAWYSARLDALVASEPSRWCRASYGRAVPGFVPDIDKAFFRRPNGGGREATLGSPKDIGRPIGKVTASFNARRRSFRYAGEALANGDGLGFFAADGTFTGFRLNRAAAGEAFPAGAVEGLAAGMEIYRNSDKEFADTLAKAVPERFLRVDFILERAGEGTVRLAARCCCAEYSETVVMTTDTARTPQKEGRRRLLGRLGGSGYELGMVDDKLDDSAFVPASALADLRRRVLAGLDDALIAAHRREVPAPRRLAADAFSGMELTYHDNVANALAAEFYTAHGADVRERALEAGARPDGEKRVMQTRYCIRRELGACLKTPQGAALPPELFLRDDAGRRYRLAFDCRRCGMDIFSSL